MLITRIGLRQGVRSSLKSQVRLQSDNKQSENKKPSIFDIPVSEEEINQLNADLTEGIKEFRFPPPADRKKILTDISQTIIREYKPLYDDFMAGKIKPDRVPHSVLNLPESQRGSFVKFFESQQGSQENFSKTHGDASVAALDRFNAVLNNKNTPMKKEPIHVAITGASGQIGYALLFRIASGDMFGPHQPVVLKLLELPQAMTALKGVVMELRDCAFPLVSDIVMTDNPEKAFEAVDYALLVGASPRKEGMERADLLLKNAEIFSIQGKALNTVGKGKDTRIAVVGNPANTNALIAQRNAPKIPAENFSAMTRLDHNRGLAQLAEKANVQLDDISRFVIWGNHSATQFPDISHAYIKGQPADEVINNTKWLNDTFIPVVQQRGAAIIKARGSSSAASAAGALVDHIYDWHHGTHTEWTSMAVFSKGEYGVEHGLFYSYPVVINDFKEWTVVKNLPITEWAAQKMEATHKELQQERDGVAKFLPK